MKQRIAVVILALVSIVRRAHCAVRGRRRRHDNLQYIIPAAVAGVVAVVTSSPS